MTVTNKREGRNIILTDIDGVIFDWNTPFDDFHSHLAVDQTDEHVKGQYNVSDRFGLTQEAADQLVAEYIHNHMPSLDLVQPDIIDNIMNLHEAGFSFVGLTSISLDPEIRQKRIKNLEQFFGPNVFEECYCLPTGSKKRNALYSMIETYGPRIKAWVEDNVENAHVGAQLNLKTFLYNQPYNINSQVNWRITRVDHWKEIEDYFLNPTPLKYK